jgi:hypothetical protein
MKDLTKFCKKCPAADFNVLGRRGICRLDPSMNRRIKKDDWCMQHPMRQAAYQDSIARLRQQ